MELGQVRLSEEQPEQRRRGVCLVRGAKGKLDWLPWAVNEEVGAVVVGKRYGQIH